MAALVIRLMVKTGRGKRKEKIVPDLSILTVQANAFLQKALTLSTHFSLPSSGALPTLAAKARKRALDFPASTVEAGKEEYGWEWGWGNQPTVTVMTQKNPATKINLTAYCITPSQL